MIFVKFKSDEYGLPSREREHLIEDEIAEAVEDDAVFIFFNRLKNVGMMTDDEIGSGVDSGVGKFGLFGGEGGGVFVAEVEGDEEPIDLRRGGPDVLSDLGGIHHSCAEVVF